MKRLLKLTLATILTLTAISASAEQTRRDDIKASMKKVKMELSTNIQEALANAIDNLDDTALIINGRRVSVTTWNSDSVSSVDSTFIHTTPTVMINAPISVYEPEPSGPAISHEIREIIITLCLFALPIILVYIVSMYNIRMKREQYDLVRRAMETGYELPEGLFPPRHSSYLRNLKIDVRNKGINAIAWGVGGLLFFLIIDVPQVAVLMLIPLIIGVSKVFSAKRDDDDRQPPIPPIPPTSTTPPTPPTF